MASVTASDLSRAQKLDVGKAILARLVARQQMGPKEDALDGFIPPLNDAVERLSTHVGGKVEADAARKAQLLRLERADSEVDAWLRHHESFIDVEANHRFSPHAEAARALHDAAFPDGISHVDAYIPDENRLCRHAIAVLASPEHAPTVAAIELPTAWTSKWQAALDESDAAFSEVQKARETKASHVGEGRDAEADFVELMVRLRRYMDARAPRADKLKQAENRELLQPLLDALKKLQTEKAARASRRKDDKPAGT
ncbi:hypothetical protein [Polyangium aurulentum]|uniref:hypothetical protein n=1 Tax=Polyangium aurulentum TaxID=2567896 RepID=UPI0010AE3551|nr:hypothetical protein [Polyangium aurulentum]UQA59472.1 hypothetical protein E8A73_002885 [Polyangium aurulentum]